MPSVPGNGFQFVMLLIFVLPGSVYQFSRSGLRGPSPDDGSSLNRVLRALGTSAFLAAAYAATIGPTVLDRVEQLQQAGDRPQPGQVRLMGVWALLLLFLVPMLLALADHRRRSWTPPKRLRWFGIRLAYDPTPRAWDYAFGGGIDPTYIRVLTTDGRWLGGWFGSDSFASSYPEPRELFIEAAHLMNEDGSFGEEVPRSGGLFVRCDDVRSVEFVDGGDVRSCTMEDETGQQ